MYKLGITGGIGSGKTTVSSLLEKRGATVFNADKEAKLRLQHSQTWERRYPPRWWIQIPSWEWLNLKIHLVC